MVRVIDYSIRDMLAKKADGEPYICYQCGTCTVSCLLNPQLPVRRIIREVQIGSIPKYMEVWKCISCNYCGAMCPRGVDVSKILRGIRTVLYDEKMVPNDYTEVLWRVYEEGNPLGSSRKERFAWLGEVKVSNSPDIILYTCCLSAYDRRLHSVLKSIISMLDRAGVKVGIMEEESCCGDIVYHTGEDYFFEEIASNNASIIEKSGANLLITVSPHVYHNLVNIYPKYDAKLSIPIKHHVEFLNELIDDGKISPGKVDGVVTYHDPCYLGRYNNLTEEPRNIIESIGGLEFIEMDHNRMDTLCCGGGGGGIWTENKEARSVTRNRLREAVDVEAGVMATACPYCIRMFEDEARLLKIDLEVIDVAELLARSMGDGG
jgi:Fe-S oxidoreductase